MSNATDKQKELFNRIHAMVSPLGDKCETATMVCWVTVSHEDMAISPENMTPHPSSESFCEKCITEAIEKEKWKFYAERHEFMGKIYEAETHGYFHQFENKWESKTNKWIGTRLKKYKVNPKQLAGMKMQLRKKYRAGTIISSDAMYTTSSEHEGFELCDSCGIIFYQSLLLNDQEIEHWLSLTDSKLKSSLSNKKCCYELSRIFYDDMKDEFIPQLVKLANKILYVSGYKAATYGIRVEKIFSEPQLKQIDALFEKFSRITAPNYGKVDRKFQYDHHQAYMVSMGDGVRLYADIDIDEKEGDIVVLKNCSIHPHSGITPRNKRTIEKHLNYKIETLTAALNDLKFLRVEGEIKTIVKN